MRNIATFIFWRQAAQEERYIITHHLHSRFVHLGIPSRLKTLKMLKMYLFPDEKHKLLKLVTFTDNGVTFTDNVSLSQTIAYSLNPGFVKPVTFTDNSSIVQYL